MNVYGPKNLWRHGDHPRARKLSRVLWNEVARILAKENKDLVRLQVGEPLNEETCILLFSYVRKKSQSPKKGS
jgi:hypothetical protein